MLLLLGSFLAGILTVLAPCVLPLLPVIIGGSVTGSASDKRRPLVIIASLAVSLALFTLLLKATTLFIAVPPVVLTSISGGLIIALGIVTFFPLAYSTLMYRLGIETKAQEALNKGADSKQSLLGPIIMGAALGPVFSSCSPLYVYILATVLPVSFGEALAYMAAYIIGLSSILLLISHYGRALISRLKFAANPGGWFQRTLAVIFIIVGLLIVTGYDKKVQTWVSVHTPFNFDALSAKLIPSTQPPIAKGKVYNITPQAAPELIGLTNWINSKPLTLQELRGKVVLVDFWTYTCINCIRNNPHLEGLYKAYSDKGLVIIGVHAPEFALEKVAANVEKGVKDQGITYPVALDNDFATWSAFKNQYWPAGYLIDAKGMIRRVHYGEGEYKESEQAIRGLLVEAGATLSDTTVEEDATTPISANQTPETYLGLKRASDFAGTPPLGAKDENTFAFPDKLYPDQWALEGTWKVDSEKIASVTNSKLRFRISSKEAYVVGAASSPVAVRVLLDGKPIPADKAGSDVKDGMVTFNESRLYRLVAQPSFTQNYELTLEVSAGVSLNAFTFGG